MTLHVLFLAAEAEPFVKIGGLGDVAGALPDAIHQISEKRPRSEQVDIRVVLPFHFAIKQKGFKPNYLGTFNVSRKNETLECRVFHLEKDGIPVYFLDGTPIDDKLPVYSPDPVLDGNKYVFFSLAALGLADFLDWHVDILHANDWHTATAIYAFNYFDKRSKNLAKTKTLYTLHNLPYMGSGVEKSLSDYGLPATNHKNLPPWARHIPLPLGLLYADRIIAVSPNYAKEILTPEFGCGLENFLKTESKKLDGILNGLDTASWDPKIDPHISQNYDTNSLELKTRNKTRLQEQYHFQISENTPLLTIVSRMDPQKGIDIVLRGLRYVDDLPWQAILLGTGNPHVEDMARELETNFPDRVRSVIDFDNKLAHQLYAGADIFMMPSRYEPCGLSQMISMRYGCVPIARATGGLVDTIEHISHHVNGGTGFLFERPYPSVFATTLKRAIRLYQQPEKWRKIQLNGMNIDFSWENSAKKYVDVYKEILD